MAVVPEEQVVHHALHMGVAQHSRVVTELRVQRPSDQPVETLAAPAVSNAVKSSCQVVSRLDFAMSDTAQSTGWAASM